MNNPSYFVLELLEEIFNENVTSPAWGVTGSTISFHGSLVFGESSQNLQNFISFTKIILMRWLSINKISDFIKEHLKRFNDQDFLFFYQLIPHMDGGRALEYYII